MKQRTITRKKIERLNAKQNAFTFFELSGQLYVTYRENLGDIDAEDHAEMLRVMGCSEKKNNYKYLANGFVMCWGNTPIITA